MALNPKMSSGGTIVIKLHSHMFPSKLCFEGCVYRMSLWSLNIYKGLDN